MRIKEILGEKGMTMADLAERANMQQPAISRAMTGNPTVETLERIAAALGVRVVDLFEKQGDFVAFVRKNGITHTFESERELKKFAEEL